MINLSNNFACGEIFSENLHVNKHSLRDCYLKPTCPPEKMPGDFMMKSEHYKW